jgi:hypothetical protein
MPRLIVHIKEISKHLKVGIGSNDRHVSMEGFCVHESFEVQCGEIKLSGSNFPVRVHMAPNIEKSKIKLLTVFRREVRWLKSGSRKIAIRLLPGRRSSNEATFWSSAEKLRYFVLFGTHFHRDN